MVLLALRASMVVGWAMVCHRSGRVHYLGVRGFWALAKLMAIPPRDDARYILSYTLPEPGYEGDVTLDVLQHYPQRRVITEFDVEETPGPDRAALILKFPDGPDTRARDK